MRPHIVKRFMKRVGTVEVESIDGFLRTPFEVVTFGISESSRHPAGVVDTLRRRQISAAKRLVSTFADRVLGRPGARLQGARSLAAARAYHRALRSARPARFEVEGRFRTAKLLRVARTSRVGIQVLPRGLRIQPDAPRATAADDIDTQSYMPRLWTPRTDLVGDPGGPLPTLARAVSTPSRTRCSSSGHPAARGAAATDCRGTEETIPVSEVSS